MRVNFSVTAQIWPGHKQRRQKRWEEEEKLGDRSRKTEDSCQQNMKRSAAVFVVCVCVCVRGM